MKCPLCGYEFGIDSAQSACRNCPVAHGCRLVKCPNCGYEMPAEPGILKLLRKRRHGTARTG